MSSASVLSIKLVQNFPQKDPKIEDSSSYPKKAVETSPERAIKYPVFTGPPYINSTFGYPLFTGFRALMGGMTMEKLRFGEIRWIAPGVVEGLVYGLVTYDLFSRMADIFIREVTKESIQNKLKETKIPGIQLTLATALNFTTKLASSFAAREIMHLIGYETCAASIFLGDVISTTIMQGIFDLLMYD